MSKKQSTATKAANAARAAEKAAAIRRAQEAKERRRRTLVVTASVVGVLAVVVAIAVGVQAGRDTTGQVATAPAGVTEKYVVPWGGTGAPVTVSIYEDFMCPFCGQYEAASRQFLEKYVEAGDVRVNYHVISFLDGASNGTDYSTRSMSAVGSVLDTAGALTAKKFHDLLYQNQPAENTDGLSDDQLIDLAVQAGADKAEVSGPIKNLKFEQWVKNASDQASKDGVNSTPTVMVGGEKVEGATIEELAANTQQAIEAALAE